MTLTTIELLDILAAHARHPDISPEDRALNAAELARLLKHHGLTEADLTPPGAPEWRAFDPAPATEAERLLAIHLTCALRRETVVECLGGTEALEVEATPEQWRGIAAMWTRHLPVFRRCWKTSAAPQEERMRGEMDKLRRERERLGRELESVQEELQKLPGHALRAYILAWDLPIGEAEDPADPWSDTEPLPEWLIPACVIRRAMMADSATPADTAAN